MSSTNEGERLLAAILAAPDDINARRVYGDWLLERGDVRGELIQAQCVPDTSPDYDELFAHAEALLAEHELAWTTSIRGCVTSWWFARGFPDHVQLTARRFVDKGAMLAAATPLHHVTLATLTGPLATAVATTPALARIHALCLRGAVTQPVAAALLASPHLRGLRELELDSAAAARGIASLPGLTHLMVGNTIHGRAAFGREIAVRTSRSSRGRRVPVEPVDAAWIASLARATPALRTLWLYDQAIGDDGVVALRELSIAELVLFNCGVDATSTALLRSKIAVVEITREEEG